MTRQTSKWDFGNKKPPTKSVVIHIRGYFVHRIDFDSKNLRLTEKNKPSTLSDIIKKRFEALELEKNIIIKNI